MVIAVIEDPSGLEEERILSSPSAAQNSDGKVDLVFTSQNRTVIYRAVFEEGWISGKQ